MRRGVLIPMQDPKQRLRTLRTLQAIGAALIQSLVALFIFFTGGFMICHIMRRIDFSDLVPDLNVTLSAGVARFRPREEISALLTRADKALYLAKNSGRNCIKLETEIDKS